MDASQLSVENIGTVVGVGVVAAFLAAREYLAKRKAAPAREAEDLAILAGSITDMKPVKALAFDLKRLADAAEGIKAIMLARQEADAEADADQLRDRIRDLERSLGDASGGAAPRRRR